MLMTGKRFENRLNRNKIKFNAQNPVWDNEQETAINVFEMMRLLNKYQEEVERLQFLNNNLDNILADFMNILNRLQANPNDEQGWSVVRDMLMNMEVELL